MGRFVVIHFEIAGMKIGHADNQLNLVLVSGPCLVLGNYCHGNNWPHYRSTYLVE